MSPEELAVNAGPRVAPVKVPEPGLFAERALRLRQLAEEGDLVIEMDRGDRRRVAEARAAVRDWVRHRSPYRQVRASVVGIPNTGKSSLINALAGRRRAATGDRPGITRGVEWIRLADGILLLDQPGVIGDDDVGGDAFWRRVCCGTVPEGDYDAEEVACRLITHLDGANPGWAAPLDLPGDTGGEGDLIDRLALRQGLLGPGGRPDRDRAARRLVATFRQGGLGRISLETP
ncbi:50S ribosome-binding GTPase [bacterium]|nr:50S ribosome-binding GTPase [bacterium]